MEFVFSEKNEEFVRLLTLVGKGIREENQALIEEAKSEFAKHEISVGFRDETSQIVLIAANGNPYFFDLNKYDGIKDAEIVTE